LQLRRERLVACINHEASKPTGDLQAPALTLCAVRWYLRYSLSLRDVEELLAERGLAVDHTTIWRWVQRYGPELEARLRRHLKPTNPSWRVDETYIRVQGRWYYLYRAVDSSGATIDFLLSVVRDAAAAQGLFRQALSDPSRRQPRVINTDKGRTIWLSRCRSESRRNSASPLPSSTRAISEQHPRTGPSRNQTAGEGQAGFPRVRRRATNAGRLRGHPHDPQKTGAEGLSK
jgi:transposase, IS6 family